MSLTEEVDPQQGAWLVYLNGIQVPCPSVTVSYGVWQIPEATLSFPPHRLLQRLGAEDRLEVVIFYLDTIHEPENPEFRLLFEGEIIGWSYTSTPTGRSMTFNALADISIYQALYFFFMNTVDAVIGYKTTPGAEANTAFSPGIHYPFSIFKKGLFLQSATDKEKPDIEKPYDILANLLTGLMSRPDGDAPDTRPIPCVNFFSRWARKRNFQNRFIATPIYEDSRGNLDRSLGAFPIYQSVQAEYALKAMSTSLSESVGDQGSIYDLLQKIFGMSYCELAMIPTAPMVIARLADGAIVKAPGKPRDQASIDTEPYRLVNYFAKPQSLFGAAPSCNLIFPSMIRNYTYSENYWQQPTRLYVNDQLYTGALPNKTGVVASSTSVGYPEEIDAVLQLRRATTDQSVVAKQPSATGKNVLVFPEEFYKGPVLNRLPVPAWFSHLAAARAAEERKEATPANVNAPAIDIELQQLYFLYAQYEYFRSRYEQRGGAVDMIWNPYIVPGFPCMIFDHRASAMDTAGYVLNVRQSMNAMGASSEMSTSINYSYGRTIQELLETMKADMARLGVVLSSGPTEPVDSVRAITQDFVLAEEMYRVLFHRDDIADGKQAAADIRTIVGFVEESDEYGDHKKITPISIEGEFVSRDVTYLGKTAGDRVPPVTNIDVTKDIEPLETMAPAFRNPISALEYISRPVCTLDEYITFIHGGESLDTLIAPRDLIDPVTKETYTRPVQVSGANSYFGYPEVTGKPGAYKVVRVPAKYYERIRGLIQGPGDTPPKAQTGAASRDPAPGTTRDQAVLELEKVEPVPQSSPQTRYNWDSILLDYRAEILSRLSPMR